MGRCPERWQDQGLPGEGPRQDAEFGLSPGACLGWGSPAEHLGWGVALLPVGNFRSESVCGYSWFKAQHPLGGRGHVTEGTAQHCAQGRGSLRKCVCTLLGMCVRERGPTMVLSPGQYLPPALRQSAGFGHRPLCIHESLCICVSHTGLAPLPVSTPLLSTSIGPALLTRPAPTVSSD